MCNVKVKFTGQIARRSFNLTDALNGLKVVDQNGREALKLTAVRHGYLGELAVLFNGDVSSSAFHFNGVGKGNGNQLYMGDPTVTRWVNIRADNSGRLIIGSKLHGSESSARSAGRSGQTKVIHTLSVQVPAAESNTRRLVLDL